MDRVGEGCGSGAVITAVVVTVAGAGFVEAEVVEGGGGCDGGGLTDSCFISTV